MAVLDVRSQKMGVIVLIVAFMAIGTVLGLDMLGEKHREDNAILDILVHNESTTRTVKFSVFVNENLVWENNLTRKLNVHPSGLESFQTTLERGTHTVTVIIQNGETEMERQKIEIPDENYWISMTYVRDNKILFYKADDHPIIIS